MQLNKFLCQTSQTIFTTTSTILIYAFLIIALPVMAVMYPINKVRSLFRNRSKIDVE